MQGRNLIDNNWIVSSGEEFYSTNPANDKILWQGKSAGEEEVLQAIVSSIEAFSIWKNTDFSVREKICKKYADLLQKRKENLAKIIADETGKPIWESRMEVGAMVSKLHISIAAFHERTGESVNDVKTQYLKHRPHGVLAVLGPYNFPGHLPNGHIIPALLAGNTVVFKPSEHTPLTAEYMIELWLEASIPKGVINLLQGTKKTGILLASSKKIDGLLFTGSSITGKNIYKNFIDTPGRMIALEMGGNNPLICHNIDNIDATILLIIQSAYITAGQRCTCARRLILTKEEYDKIIPKLKQAILSLKIGKQYDAPEPFYGSIINKEAAQTLLQKQKNLIKNGAKIICKMEETADGLPFLKPGLIDVSEVNNLPDEEIFGPLLQIKIVKSFSDAIKTANDTKYGLSAGLICPDRKDFELFLNSSKAGIVNWNAPTTGAASKLPFGGTGDSGNLNPSAYYAADYCSYPVASIISEKISIPTTLPPGIKL